jgi:hypothetical protein
MKNIFNLALLLGLLVSILPQGFAGDKKKYSAEEFLKIVRNPPRKECWAIMDGNVTHRRRGKDSLEEPLYLGILFTPTRSLAQVVIGSKEAYNVGQTYQGGKESTSIIPLTGVKHKDSKLAEFGLRPQDLTMSFLYGKFIEELKPEEVKGRDCRVFLLESPDKKEKVKVFISSEYFFPLRVQWFNNDSKSKEPHRTLEVKSFRKENEDFWLVSSLSLYGPTSGWRSLIEFDKTKAGYSADMVPKDLFKKFPAAK